MYILRFIEKENKKYRSEVLGLTRLVAQTILLGFSYEISTHHGFYMNVADPFSMDQKYEGSKALVDPHKG
jgi:hypothetical protein